MAQPFPAPDARYTVAGSDGLRQRSRQRLLSSDFFLPRLSLALRKRSWRYCVLQGGGEEIRWVVVGDKAAHRTRRAPCFQFSILISNPNLPRHLCLSSKPSRLLPPLIYLNSRTCEENIHPVSCFYYFYPPPSSLTHTRPLSSGMSSRSSSPYGHDEDHLAFKEADSGYSSGSTSEMALPEVCFTRAHVRFLNRQLQFLEPEEILRWSITTLPSLYQTTAFGLSGLVILDMLSKLKVPRPQMVDLIFLDTLHHFPETLSVVDRVQSRYPLVTFHTFKPEGTETSEDFSKKHGERLWETNDQLYDYLVKVEPAQRAYRELQVNAVLTGRRRSQGGKRGDLNVIEVDEAGLIKVNPLANWSFQQVQEYIKANNVPYNELLDRGYKSVGDWHSTQPVKEGEDERAGRWKGQEKTECGIHNPRSKYAQFLMEQEKKREREALEQALQKVSIGG